MKLGKEIRRWIKAMKREAQADGMALRYSVTANEGNSYSILLDMKDGGTGTPQEGGEGWRS